MIIAKFHILRRPRLAMVEKWSKLSQNPPFHISSVYRGSETDQIVDEMITNMKFQIENPALLNSRFVFNEFLYLDINFHQLNLMRGSSYLPLPDWLGRKKVIVNPHNDDEECFKWSVIAVENVGMKDPQ